MKKRTPQKRTREQKQLAARLHQRVSELIEQKGIQSEQSTNALFRKWISAKPTTSQTNPRLTTLVAIAQELRITVSELFEGLF